MGLCIRVERAGDDGHQIVCFGLRLMKSLLQVEVAEIIYIIITSAYYNYYYYEA